MANDKLRRDLIDTAGYIEDGSQMSLASIGALLLEAATALETSHDIEVFEEQAAQVETLDMVGTLRFLTRSGKLVETIARMMDEGETRRTGSDDYEQDAPITLDRLIAEARDIAKELEFPTEATEEG